MEIEEISRAMKTTQQLDCPGEQAHADSAKDDERVKLALVVAVFGQRVEREQQGHEDDAADEDVEEDGEGTGFDRARRSRFRQEERAARGSPREPAWFQWRATQPSGRRGHPGGSEASISMTRHAGEREDDLGKDAEDVRNRIHRWTSA